MNPGYYNYVLVMSTGQCSPRKPHFWPAANISSFVAQIKAGRA